MERTHQIHNGQNVIPADVPYKVVSGVQAQSDEDTGNRHLKPHDTIEYARKVRRLAHLDGDGDEARQ
tara:strand:- start:3502 stop:3702 length:201 start_codon:yes stop_codon:yes gene_type:complete